MKMAELWDIYTEDRMPTGRLHERGVPIPQGDYHIVVNCWVVTGEGEILLSQRDPAKPFGNLWECTGGSVVAGEDSLLGALREVKEEVGIDLRGLRPFFLGTEKRRNDFLDSWLFFLEGRRDVTLQAGETVDYRWVTAAEYREMEREKLIVPTIHAFPMVTYAMERWKENGDRPIVE